MSIPSDPGAADKGLYWNSLPFGEFLWIRMGIHLREFMFINHESGHCQKEKLVVSPAFNQVVQSSLDRLLRVNPSMCFCPLQMITHPRLRVYQPQSGSYSCEQPRPVPLPAQPPVAARSTHLATPRAISTPIRCRQCPPQVIEDQWAKSPTPWFFHSATAVHSRSRVCDHESAGDTGDASNEA